MLVLIKTTTVHPDESSKSDESKIHQHPPTLINADQR
jgi:hypothetical protein